MVGNSAFLCWVRSNSLKFLLHHALQSGTLGVWSSPRSGEAEFTTGAERGGGACRGKQGLEGGPCRGGGGTGL